MAYYAIDRSEVAEGARIKHITTGGTWMVVRVNADGSVSARSDMGAHRTVSAEHVDAGLALGADANAYRESMESVWTQPVARA